MEPFWVIAVIGGPVILGIAMMIGLWQWNHRRTSDRIRDEAARTNYRNEERREKRIEAEKEIDAAA